MRGDPVPVWVCVAAPTPELPTWDPGGKEADPAKGRWNLLPLCHEALEPLEMCPRACPQLCPRWVGALCWKRGFGCGSVLSLPSHTRAGRRGGWAQPQGRMEQGSIKGAIFAKLWSYRRKTWERQVLTPLFHELVRDQQVAILSCASVSSWKLGWQQEFWEALWKQPLWGAQWGCIRVVSILQRLGRWAELQPDPDRPEKGWIRASDIGGGHLLTPASQQRPRYQKGIYSFVSWTSIKMNIKT